MDQRRSRLFLRSALLLLVGLVLSGSLAAGAAPAPQQITAAGWRWPLDGNPPLALSSTYGPRLRASSNFRYDYHQGLDMPTPLSTTVKAVYTGTVRIAGSHPSYSDGVVQIDHGNNIYSNYLHVSASLVNIDDVVAPGDPIALSGASDSGFPHLHFEIREGGVQRRYAINPLRYLPYADTLAHTVAITEVLPSHAVWVQVTAPETELDVEHVTLTVRSDDGSIQLDQRTLDFDERNLAYDGDPALLDNPDLEQIHVAPHAFTSSSTQYVLDVRFQSLAGSGPVQVEACAVDVHDQSVCTTAQGQFAPLTSTMLPTVLK